ncbi:MAG: 50S ribosomal protein L11 [Bacilli bacterium]|nr:50S ribosomal protein L11 [Bacilli bacterium]
MAKEIFRKVKLQIEAGKATPAPPVGTAVGPLGINIQDFCQKYNDATRDKMGNVIPVELTVYTDKSFDFVLKTPPAAKLIKQYAKINKASSKGANEIVATLTKEDVQKIAETKMVDLNAYDIDAAMKIIEGTARNMGVAVKGVNDAELAEQAKEAIAEEREAAKREAALEAMEASAADTSVDVEVTTEKKDEESTEE